MFDKAVQILPSQHQARLSHLGHGVRYGFSVGSLAMPSHTVLAPEHYRADQQEIVMAWKDKAIQDGFAAGPFQREAIEKQIGPFACVPLTIVHTPATSSKPEKNRVCFNASWSPSNHDGGAGVGSINDEVAEEAWECEWFLITEVKVILSGATLETWAMGFDLSDAYQQVPNLPRQRRRFVFQVGMEFFVWLVGMFGIATMSAIFGQLCDVLCVWLEREFPSVRARHFADDHMVLHEGSGSRPEEDAVYAVVASFGWRVHPTKRFGWSRRFTLLGFEWDLDTQCVRLTEEKRVKYVDRLRSIRGRHLSSSERHSRGGSGKKRKVRYSEVASVVGMMVHVCAIFPERRSTLNGLYALRAAFHRPNRHHALDITTAAYSEIRDWIQFLDTPHLSRSFSVPERVFPVDVYSDASNMGCGVVVDGRARYWSLPGIIEQEGVDIGVMEAWALQLALQTSILLGASGSVVRFHVDNLGVVYGLWKGRSRSKWTNRCLRRISELALAAEVVMSVVYVASKDNLADLPSRGDCEGYQPLELDLACPWQEFQRAAADA